MSWKFTGDAPVYQQIMDCIRGDILRGEYRPGDRIPAVRELAVQARVNPNTMQRAMMELEREGLLVSCGTIGRFVTSDPAVLEQARRTVHLSVARRCAQMLEGYGLTLEQAAALVREETT